MGVHKIQKFIRDILEHFLRNFFGEEIGGGQGHSDPLITIPQVLKNIFAFLLRSLIAFEMSTVYRVISAGHAGVRPISS